MGEELGVRGEKEGRGSEKEEGVEETCRGGRITRQPPGARKSARGRPASPSLPLGRMLGPRRPRVSYPEDGQKSRCSVGSGARDPGLRALATLCHILPYGPR